MTRGRAAEQSLQRTVADWLALCVPVPQKHLPSGLCGAARLDTVHDISHAEFARRCGRSPKLISEIIAGKAPVEPETALQFEKVLGVDASVWLGVEADYQLHKAREAEARRDDAASVDKFSLGTKFADIITENIPCVNR